MRLTASLFRRPPITHATTQPSYTIPPHPDGLDHATTAIDRLIDDRLADSELHGRVARTTERLERLAAELEARHVRYAWTEQLAADLRAIAHDTSTSGRS